MLTIRARSSLGAFLWENPQKDHWSKIGLDHGASEEPKNPLWERFFRSFDTPWSKRSWTNDLHLSINWRKSVKNMSWTWLPPIYDSRESCSGEAPFGYLMKNRPHDIVIQWNSDWLIIIFSSYALATQLLYNQCLTRVDSAEFGAYHSTLQLEMFSAPLPLVSLLWFDLMYPNLVLAKVRLIF